MVRAAQASPDSVACWFWLDVDINGEGRGSAQSTTVASLPRSGRIQLIARDASTTLGDDVPTYDLFVYRGRHF